VIEGLKPYPAYKASGLPWADLIPQHWGLLPNRALVRKRKVLVGEQHHSYRLLSLTKQGVIVRDVASGKGKFSSDMGTSQEVRIGDLVFCLFDVPETPRTVGLSAHAGMITGAYTVFESIVQKTAGYFEVFYRAMDDRKLLSPLYSGLRNTIPPDRLLGTKTPQPPADEQAAIVRFLDHANRRIDRFIRAKRKLIALLNEQKQAIIHRAVTRGLAPNVPMKDSGVPWLGEIPAHWQVKKIKHLVTTIGGMTPNKSTARFWSGEIPWVSPKDMKRKLIEDSRDHISALAIRATGIALIPPPAVLIVVRGMILARTFPTAVTGMATTINQDMKALLPGDEVDAGYLSFLLTGLEGFTGAC
jgi:type I restriction enzyme S subunit